MHHRGMNYALFKAFLYILPATIDANTWFELDFDYKEAKNIRLQVILSPQSWDTNLATQ